MFTLTLDQLSSHYTFFRKATPTAAPTGPLPTAVPIASTTAWLWNPDINQATSPWTVTATPGPVSYCGNYVGPAFLCNPWHIVDGTPAAPLGANGGDVNSYTAYDYAAMSGPPYHFTVDFGSATTFDTWRLAGLGACVFGFKDAALEVQVGGAWQEIAGSAVSGRPADIVDGWSVSAVFSAAVTATAVRVNIKEKADCSADPASPFQLYVKGFNVGYNPTAAPTPELSAIPTAKPSAEPSAGPSATPSTLPSVDPSAIPTIEPSASPTATPSTSPSAEPSTNPST